MAQIRLDNVGVSYVETLFSGVSMTIAETHRVGIVGDNGCGKSTLLKCIAGVQDPSEGKITAPRGCKFGFIEQTVPEALHDKTLYDVIAEAIPHEERDYSLWKVDVALDTFKAPETMRQQAIKHLSGGWQRLALIARTWMGDPDVLLLDEPTNHLDLEKVFLLEQWLNEQVQGVPLICISHDRQFLDNCTNTTLFLRSVRSASYGYSFSRAKELLAQDDQAANAQRDKELKEVERLRKSALELRKMGANFHSASSLNKSVQIEARADNILSQVREVYVAEKRDIKLSNSGTHAKTLVALKDVEIATPDGRSLFKVSKLGIGQGERVVILGANGSGKSMMVSRIYKAFGNIEKAKGQGIAITPTAKLGYVDQQLSALPLDETVREYILQEFGQTEQRTTTLLIDAGFAFAAQDKKIGLLSFGERSRLMLLSLRLAEPNFYVMDEPTNHLDIPGQVQLESEILRHGAACILVSHDRSFVSNLGTRFLVIQDGALLEIDDPELYYRAMSDGTPIPANKAHKVH